MADKIIFGLNCVNGDNAEIDIAAVCTEDNRPGFMLEGKTFTKDDLGGTKVVANPTLAGSESNLDGLQVGETKYKVPSGTEVTANPTLAGTESALTGLQVGNDKYKVPDPGTTVVANPTLAGTEQDLVGLQVGGTKYKISAGDTWTATALYKRLGWDEDQYRQTLNDFKAYVDIDSETTKDAFLGIITECFIDPYSHELADGTYSIVLNITPSQFDYIIKNGSLTTDNNVVWFAVQVEEGQIISSTSVSQNVYIGNECYGIALCCFTGEDSSGIPSFTLDEKYYVLDSETLNEIFTTPNE